VAAAADSGAVRVVVRAVVAKVARVAVRVEPPRPTRAHPRTEFVSIAAFDLAGRLCQGQVSE